MLETTTENQQERLIVKNFGPLKDVDIELKDIMVFIGPQASGKSTLAKILHIVFNGLMLMPVIENSDYKKFFKRANINFFTKNTAIQFYIGDNIIVNCNDDNIEVNQIDKKSNESLKNSIQPQLEAFYKTTYPNYTFENFLNEYVPELVFNNITSTYIPAERNIISNLSDSIMGVLASGVSIPKSVLDFGNKFEIARRELKKTYIDFLNITYEYSFETGSRIFTSPEQSIFLFEAASGFQSIIPLYLVTKHFAKSLFLIIEEPELNLFPETQKKLVEFIIETCRDKTKRLIITTHSPYILTTLNGLIQAHNTARTKPELKDKVAEIVPESRWIDFDKIGVYHVADGTVKRIMDDEYRLIDANPIDDVSDKLGREFDELLDLKYDE